MAISDLTSFFSRLVHYPSFNVIYGHRGVGKSSFLFQLALTNLSARKKIIIMPKRSYHIKIICRLLKGYSKNLRKNLIIKTINDNPRELILLLARIENDGLSRCLLILDDVIPLRFYIAREWNQKLARAIGLITPLLLSLLNHEISIWISAPELSGFPLPRRWQFFIEMTNKFYRLRRIRRIRELFLVKLTNLPKNGDYWDITPKDLRIETVLLGRFILTERGFIPIAQEES